LKKETLMNHLTKFGAVAFALVAAQSAHALDFFAITADQQLVRFDADTPGTISSTVSLSGFQTGETILGIDTRPATGELFALGSSSRLYRIDTTTGSATQVGSTLSTSLNGTSFGFDFNPLVDRIRVTSNTGQNLRLNPDTGAVAAVDGTLAYAAGDPNAGQTPSIVASAYTNNFAGTTATTLFNIDSNGDRLVTQNPPNAGTLNTIGSLGLDVTDVSGFDLVTRDGVNSAFAALNVTGQTSTGFYAINLSTGSAALVGQFQGNITAVAAVPEPATALALLLGLPFLRRRSAKK